MLQQTQVSRVLEKYPPFIARLPGAGQLAEASLAEVLRLWNGLGYNRRALRLKQTGETLVAEYAGEVPDSLAELGGLPGVGPATAAAVAVFAFGQAHAFLETNIRAVLLHHFCEGETGVPDARLLRLAEITLDRRDPRNWYYALMDYGSDLKKHSPGIGRGSRAHKRQPRFEGSRRQLRSWVLKELLTAPGATAAQLEARETRPRADARVADVLVELEREGFLAREGTGYRIEHRGA
jgi:A/G-specific adenine glycosylase